VAFGGGGALEHQEIGGRDRVPIGAELALEHRPHEQARPGGLALEVQVERLPLLGEQAACLFAELEPGQAGLEQLGHEARQREHDQEGGEERGDQRRARPAQERPRAPEPCDGRPHPDPSSASQASA
jgi:hypothetical protein